MLIIVIAVVWFAIATFTVMLCRGAARADAVAMRMQREAEGAALRAARLEGPRPRASYPRAAAAPRFASAARRREERCLAQP